MCRGKKSYRLDDYPERILEEMTREKRSTDSIEKEPDFVGFGGKSLVKTTIVNINELWRGKKIQSQIRLKKKHWFWTIVITKKTYKCFHTMLDLELLNKNDKTTKIIFSYNFVAMLMKLALKLVRLNLKNYWGFHFEPLLIVYIPYSREF